MRIIQRGINPRTFRPKPIVCPKCGCVFEVQGPKDIIISKGAYSVTRMLVYCPNSSCKHPISLHSEKVEWVKQNIGGCKDD